VPKNIDVPSAICGYRGSGFHTFSGGDAKLRFKPSTIVTRAGIEEFRPTKLEPNYVQSPILAEGNLTPVDWPDADDRACLAIHVLGF
jgi:hypothetical protein